MNHRFRGTSLAALALAVAAPFALAVTPQAPSQVAQSWRSADGWLTELRRHPDGTASCATAKDFTDPHAFGIFMLRSGNVTLFSLVDQQQPFAQASTMKLAQDGREVGSFNAQAEGPALATAEANSGEVRTLIGTLGSGVLTIDAAGRQYKANLAGIGPARSQLNACVAQMTKAGG